MLTTFSSVVFSSHIFLFYFLPFALLVYYATPSRFRATSLTLLSYLFYGWWSPWFTLLMLGSTLVDYGCGKLISAEPSSSQRRRAGLWISVCTNLFVLGFFKYSLFFANSAASIGIALPQADFLYAIILPVGISFYTFQSMSYSIDLYRGHARPARSFIDFACYVSMFPQLVAGPIVRYGSVAEQLRERQHSIEGFIAGFTRFSYGFAKKILIANQVGIVADSCFGAGDGSLSATMAWLGVLAYAFQIYFDFSAYSDMAIGLGRMFGFRYPENFNSPYRAAGFSDFWRRWHISLSSFLRDYLYIPLGGNRSGQIRTLTHIMIVMAIGGLWHGAQWTFVIWGLLHGILLVLERCCSSAFLGKIPHPLRIASTFVLILITWVFFRASSLDAALAYLSSMFGLSPTSDTAALLHATVLTPINLSALTIAAALVWICPNTSRFLDTLTCWKCIVGIVLLIISVCLMYHQEFNPFLYFQF